MKKSKNINFFEWVWVRILVLAKHRDIRLLVTAPILVSFLLIGLDFLLSPDGYTGGFLQVRV